MGAGRMANNQWCKGQYAPRKVKGVSRGAGRISFMRPAGGEKKSWCGAQANNERYKIHYAPRRVSSKS